MNTIFILQIVVALILIALILIQDRSSGLSGIFGAGGTDASYHTMRGLEKWIFVATLATAAIFAALAVIKLAS